MMDNTLESALAYENLGWSVIPVAAGAKHPIIKWAPYQHARASEAEIRNWFSQWPDANIGVVTGAISDVVVLDVDSRHGGDDSLAKIELRNGALPRTIEAVTGGGGRHIYFRHPGGTVRNKVGLAPGIDVRGDGGLVVVPPSVHPSGRRYVWRKSHQPGKASLADMPDWLLRIIKGPPGSSGHPLRHWRELVKTGVAEGERNNTVASLAGYLFWHGMDQEVTLDLLLCWNAERCRPPLPEDEVARTIESIARLHFHKRAASEEKQG